MVRFNEILYEAIASKSGIFISKQIFDIGDLNLFSILIIGGMTNLRLDVQTVIFVHLSEASLLLFHTFEDFLGVDYLYFSVFVDKKEDIDIVFFLKDILLPNGLFIILFSDFFCGLLMIEIG